MDLEQLKSQNYFMDQFANADPKMQMLAQLIGNKQNPETKSNTGTVAKLKNKARVLASKVKKLELQKKHLLKYIDFFLDVNASFSGAVGACECWGEDNECKKCKGNGLPGYFNVDADAFNNYVKPCLKDNKVQQSA